MSSCQVQKLPLPSSGKHQPVAGIDLKDWCSCGLCDGASMQGCSTVRTAGHCPVLGLKGASLVLGPLAAFGEVCRLGS